METTIKQLSGWDSSIYHGLRDWAIIVFGEDTDYNSSLYSRRYTTDKTVNRLLNDITGAFNTDEGGCGLRLMIRVQLIQMIAHYIQTKEFNKELYDSLMRNDRVFWSNGFISYCGNGIKLLN